jgi:hypothetical protein
VPKLGLNLKVSVALTKSAIKSTAYSATNGPICMIEHAKLIDRTSMNIFPLRIILIGPFFKEICAENAKRRSEGTPRRERVNNQEKTMMT